MIKETILTGDRPTGPLHLGHYIGSLLSRTKLQHQHLQYVMVADVQALTDNYAQPEKIRHNIIEVLKDYLAVGIDPELSTIFLQSQIASIAELTVYYLNLVSVARLERNPTVKLELQQKNFNASIPAGFLCYPISQAADITAFRATLIPVGEDQLPMLEQTNEIVRKFNRLYNSNYLLEANASLTNISRLVGIDGKAKASKSLNNCIFLRDDPQTIKEKVFAMYTDANHLKVSDPGKVAGNVVFSYLDAFHEDKQELAALKAHYTKGGLGDMALKKILNEDLQKLLAPINEKRQSLAEKDLRDILAAGSAKCAKVADETLRQVKDIMGIFNQGKDWF
jgi:tryptophanyl-tRNA synthetase